MIETDSQKLPIKLWMDEFDDLESGAWDQVKNLANYPFAFKHIAIMSDSHFGYGMPIGGVMATIDVIVPNAVGVDIGCFSGDTKIPLLNGTQKTLKELTEIGKEVFVYSLDNNLNLVVGRATPKLTRKNAQLIEVTISGGETIKCTPDHKFMLLDGSYKEAKDLEVFDSLMPLYRSYESKDGYEHIKTASGTGIATHRMVAKQFLGEKKDTDITHHKDENWFNNEPSNLEYKDARLHSKEHRQNNPIFGTEEFKKKRLDSLKKNGFYNPKFKNKKKNIAVKNIDKYNKSDKKIEQDKLAGQRGKEYLIKYNKSEKGRKKSSEIGSKFGFGKKSNHKVLYLREVSNNEDVYCLTVEKYHNFALSAGVFVHNCGMCAVKTSLTEIDTETLKKIMGEIREQIPVGFKKHKEEQNEDLMPELYPKHLNPLKIVNEEYSNALKSLGTLGGGNHFIEIQKGDDGHIWIMIHSGSRNLGFTVANHYNKLAVELNEKWHTSIPKEWELAFLPIDSEEGQAYIDEMNYCVEFALANRESMMDRIKEIFTNYSPSKSILGCTFEQMINIAHNYAKLENHFGHNVWVHRKGATLARKDTIGIIPGSQGTSSYIVQGLGNRESFMSCSHGAGRKMGGNQAKKNLNLNEEIKKLNDKGVIHAIRGVQDLDEAPGSYKDIDWVIKQQKDLIKIITKLSPLAVIKG